MSYSDHGATSRLRPATLSFLAIYNPALGGLGEENDALKEQIVYYHAPEDGTKHNSSTGDARSEQKRIDEAENEQLRQVGLAQGMVDFAKNFSSGTPADSIETEKSRIVLHELETGWWVLASIELTRLPSVAITSNQSDTAGGPDKSSVEWSSREVAPPQLLLAHLKRAHAQFLLHHAPTLQELYSRVGRQTFCSLLERYWDRFARGWDVLLHGNPAVEIYNGVKVAGGGELGVGVGEEEWGSGEREVLEDFVRRTEGCVECLVGRYGDEPTAVELENKNHGPGGDRETQKEPWLGRDLDTRPSDGIVFSGVGALSRRSVATVSQWIEAIFKQGDDAYGVGENPSSRSRRRKPAKHKPPKSSEAQTKQRSRVRPNVKLPHGRPPDLRKQAMDNNAAPPGIPPPLVTSTNRSSDQTSEKIKPRQANKSQPPENPQDQATDPSPMFGGEKMMKYLTLGYGSSWTLSPKGLTGTEEPEQRSTDETGQTGVTISDPSEITESVAAVPPEQHHDPLKQVDPIPEDSEDDEHPFVQRLEQSIGKFIIGLSGDLDTTELQDEQNDDEDREGPSGNNQQPQRIVIRTLTVEMANPQADLDIERPPSRASKGSTTREPPTSAQFSIEGAQPIISHRKLQTAVYVHQPFVFCFLFELHTPNLSIPGFFRGLHCQLGPLQKPLLRSTDPTRVAERMAGILAEKSGASTNSPPESGEAQNVYDLILDPVLLSVRTTIPNIPLPGSLAAEGLSRRTDTVTVSGSWYTLGIPITTSTSLSSLTQRDNTASLIKSDWTRVEALNVHMQILNAWTATRTSGEAERSVKTVRGWWVVWMKVQDAVQGVREAVLVRKAGDPRSSHHLRDGSSSITSPGGGPGKWLLREQAREVSGSSGQSGASVTPAGVSEGVGVDTKRWVEGLMHFV